MTITIDEMRSELLAMYEQAQETVTIESDEDCRHVLAAMYTRLKNLHDRLENGK